MSEVTVLLELIKQHAEDDTRRFAAVGDKLDEIAADVKSLLDSRAQGRGARRAVVAVAGTTATVVSGLFALITWWFR